MSSDNIVIIAEDFPGQYIEFEKQLINLNIALVKCENIKGAVMHRIYKHEPKAVIFNHSPYSNKDICDLVEFINECKVKPRLINICSFDVIDRLPYLLSAGVNYNLQMPFQNEEIAKLVEFLCRTNIEGQSLKNKVKLKTTELLNIMGMKSVYSGKTYIVQCVGILCFDSSALWTSGRIYEKCAKLCFSSSEKVKKAIAKAIKANWKDSPDEFKRLLDIKPGDDKIPENLWFITAVADYVKRHFAYEFAEYYDKKLK